MNLDGAFAFSREWHGEPWRVGDLGAAMDATVRFDPMGTGTLGISSQVDGVRLISLSERVQDDPLLCHAILLHEGGHLLTDTTGGACSPVWKPLASEVPAWFAASLLAVSAKQTALHLAGYRSVPDIAEENSVPLDLVRVGLNLREQAAGILCPKRMPLMNSLVDWIAEMQQRLKALPS